MRRITAIVVTAVMVIVAGPLGAVAADDLDLNAGRDSGTVSAFGNARDLGPGAAVSSGNATALAATASGDGYWIVSTDGTVTAHGDAVWFGDASTFALRSPIVDMARTGSGAGYWLTGGDGGIFAFGDARYFGSVPGALPLGARLSSPIVAMAPASSGHGYWIIGGDGGVFAFGDARYLGSVPGALGAGRSLSGQIVDIATTSSGSGYWLAGDDGGVFSFGDATFKGSAAGQGHISRVASITPVGDGYLLAYSDGEVAAFGASHLGDSRLTPGALSARVVDIEARHGGGYWLLYGRASAVGFAESESDVEALQKRLTDLGYWLGDIDGRFGNLTSQAVMAFQKWEGLTRSGQVDDATLDQLTIAVRPRAATTVGDSVEIDLTHQVVIVVRDGQVEWVFNTSTGSGKPYEYNGRWYHARTSEGSYAVNWERPVGWRISHLGALWRPKYFNGGIALHGSGSVPAYPASHGCVRLSIGAMDFFYEADLAPIGVKVWVYSDNDR